MGKGSAGTRGRGLFGEGLSWTDGVGRGAVTLFIAVLDTGIWAVGGPGDVWGGQHRTTGRCTCRVRGLEWRAETCRGPRESLGALGGVSYGGLQPCRARAAADGDRPRAGREVQGLWGVSCGLPRCPDLIPNTNTCLHAAAHLTHPSPTCRLRRRAPAHTQLPAPLIYTPCVAASKHPTPTLPPCHSLAHTTCTVVVRPDCRRPSCCRHPP